MCYDGKCLGVNKRCILAFACVSWDGGHGLSLYFVRVTSCLVSYLTFVLFVIVDM
jgi:hypothetical protein